MRGLLCRASFSCSLSAVPERRVWQCGAALSCETQTQPMTTSQNDGCRCQTVTPENQSPPEPCLRWSADSSRNMLHSALASCVFCCYATRLWPVQDGGRISCAQQANAASTLSYVYGWTCCSLTQPQSPISPTRATKPVIIHTHSTKTATTLDKWFDKCTTW